MADTVNIFTKQLNFGTGLNSFRFLEGDTTNDLLFQGDYKELAFKCTFGLKVDGVLGETNFQSNLWENGLYKLYIEMRYGTQLIPGFELFSFEEILNAPIQASSSAAFLGGRYNDITLDKGNGIRSSIVCQVADGSAAIFNWTVVVDYDVLRLAAPIPQPLYFRGEIRTAYGHSVEVIPGTIPAIYPNTPEIINSIFAPNLFTCSAIYEDVG